MLIILEGCDGSGKTTLAKSLAKILDADIIHCTSRTPNDKKFFPTNPRPVPTTYKALGQC